MRRTKMVIQFFKEQLKFTDEEVIFFTEDEVRTLVELLD